MIEYPYLSLERRKNAGTGHKSLSIFVRYTPNLLSARDPSSLVRRAREGASHIAALGSSAFWNLKLLKLRAP